MNLIFIFVLGAFIGSFLGAWSYRLPRNLSIAKGRSFCPKCKAQISWYDNIPLFSYLILGGRCRACRKKIGLREPLIELVTALSFVIVFFFQNHILTNVSWILELGAVSTFFTLFVLSILLVIFVIDLEHQIIPDITIFLLFAVCLVAFILTDSDKFYLHLVSGFAGSLTLLGISMVTRGKGMGYGDVKFAVPLGFILGWPFTLWWLLLSFVSGGVIASFLLLFGGARLRDKIAFGPFMITGFFLCLYFADKLFI